MERKIKIALVDDDKNFTDMFSTLLELNGYECSASNNPTGFIDVCKKFKPDLIISDMLMPGINGMELRKKINNTPDLKNLPFIFLSSQADEETILNGYNLSADDYIIKTEPGNVITRKIAARLNTIKKTEAKIKNTCRNVENQFALNLPSEIDGVQVEHFKYSYEQKPGGDFTDHIQTSKNIHNIVLYDIMGHNITSWLTAFPFISYIRSIVRNLCSDNILINTKEVLCKANEAILADSSLANIITNVSVLSINTEKQIVSYSGAGDMPLITISGNRVETIKSEGIPLGIKNNGSYNREILKMQKNDVILLHTDGLVETSNETDLRLEQKGLIGFIKHLLPNNFSLNNLVSEVKSFSNKSFEDDVTAVLITF